MHLGARAGQVLSTHAPWFRAGPGWRAGRGHPDRPRARNRRRRRTGLACPIEKCTAKARESTTRKGREAQLGGRGWGDVSQRDLSSETPKVRKSEPHMVGSSQGGGKGAQMPGAGQAGTLGQGRAVGEGQRGRRRQVTGTEWGAAQADSGDHL